MRPPLGELHYISFGLPTSMLPGHSRNPVFLLASERFQVGSSPLTTLRAPHADLNRASILGDRLLWTRREVEVAALNPFRFVGDAVLHVMPALRRLIECAHDVTLRRYLRVGTPRCHHSTVHKHLEV
jgi:hypothetical protein